jgi:hypothetical protein
MEAVSFLATAGKRYRPSMRRVLDGQALWDGVLRQLRRRAKLGGEPLPGLPDRMPFDLAELLDPEADPRDLAARLAAAMAAT